MEFKGFKKIWDGHQQEHFYQINEQELHTRVIRNSQGIRRMADTFDWGMLAILGALASVMLLEGLWDQEYYQIPESIILFIVCLYLLWDRRKRLGIARIPVNSLKQELEKALMILDYHILRRRNFIWWFVLPLITTTLIHLFFTYQGKPWWLWPLALGSFAWSYWMVDKELNRLILPKREDLKALQMLFDE